MPQPCSQSLYNIVHIYFLQQFITLLLKELGYKFAQQHIYQKLYCSQTLRHVADDEEHVGDAEADQEVVEEGRHGSGSEKIGLDGKLVCWK